MLFGVFWHIFASGFYLDRFIIISLILIYMNRKKNRVFRSNIILMLSFVQKSISTINNS